MPTFWRPLRNIGSLVVAAAAAAQAFAGGGDAALSLPSDSVSADYLHVDAGRGAGLAAGRRVPFGVGDPWPVGTGPGLGLSSLPASLLAGYNGTVGLRIRYHLGLVWQQGGAAAPSSFATSGRSGNGGIALIDGSLTYRALTLRYRQAWLERVGEGQSDYLDFSASVAIGQGLVLTPAVLRGHAHLADNAWIDYTDYSLLISKEVSLGLVLSASAAAAFAAPSPLAWARMDGAVPVYSSLVLGLRYDF